ncbi:hypothetical protein [Algibacillus agarilyticus]|uniref:hypothetical protein n=1 Tax=Algibacillus agarilyticus TaxID=2234133 RepID=UPI000DD05B99|nr:hypothetical protein [Algibacillus agarilyticus]
MISRGLQFAYLACFCLLVSACSTSTPREYGVSKLADQATHYFEWAEQLRRQESYVEADIKYKHAYSFFVARNDMKWVVNCYLKRALIAIKQNNFQLAQQLIEHGQLIAKIEAVSSQPSVDFAQAKLWFAKKAVTKAADLIETLVVKYKDDPERYAYYIFHLWLYDKNRVALAKVEGTLTQLTQRYDERKLQRIEILMFALNNYAQRGVNELTRLEEQSVVMGENEISSAAIESALLRLIDLYGLYEMTPALQRTLQLTSKYYQKINNQLKSQYYQHKFEVLSRLN